MALFSVPKATQDGTLILLDCEQEFPCSAYAIHALKVAVEHRKRWVRVEKRGHACQYDVNELVEYCERNAGTIPKALVYSRREHEAAGGHLESRVPVWPGLGKRTSGAFVAEEQPAS